MNGLYDHLSSFKYNGKSEFSAKQTGGIRKKHLPSIPCAGYYFVKAGIGPGV